METKKSVEMESALEGIAQNLFGRSRADLDRKCVTCGSWKTNRLQFRDELSWKEFSISKMCQKCQDSVFGE